MALVGRCDTRPRLVFLPANCQNPYQWRGRVEAELPGDTAELKSMDSLVAEVTTAIADTRQDCQSKAAEFEAAVKCRAEELGALAKAGTVISQKTGGAKFFPVADLSKPPSHASLSSHSDLACTPTSIDWNQMGATTLLKDQEQCGPCWEGAMTVCTKFAVSCGRTGGAAHHLVRQDSWRVQRRRPAHSH